MVQALRHTPRSGKGIESPLHCLEPIRVVSGKLADCHAQPLTVRLHRPLRALLMQRIQRQRARHRPFSPCGLAGAAHQFLRKVPKQQPPELRQVSGRFSDAAAQICQIRADLVRIGLVLPRFQPSAHVAFHLRFLVTHQLPPHLASLFESTYERSL